VRSEFEADAAVAAAIALGAEAEPPLDLAHGRGGLSPGAAGVLVVGLGADARGLVAAWCSMR
jgi:hypothetical protein